MTELIPTAFLELVSAQRGHFHLESGHHGALWLDLDALFAAPRRVAPFVDAMVDAIAPHEVDTVCGPLLGGAFLAQRVASGLGAEFCFTERVAPAHVGGLYQTKYRLPRAFRDRVAGKRVAIVDDVMSAGSALGGTCDELLAYGAVPIAAGAILVLGSTGSDLLHAKSIPVEAVMRVPYAVWLPSECPLCAERVPLVDAAPPA